MRHATTSLNEKLKTSQQTPANKADPKMSIQVSRARMTVMDSDYWKVETIRQKDGLGEVSVAPRRDRPYGSPNQIYEIHIDNGMIGTAIREYPDTFEEGWKNQFSLGPGSSVAIAFDGYWSRFRKLWRLVTEEKPWIFWVDNNNTLWRQLWGDDSTKNQLATDVIKVKALRAWKNVNLPDRDQGIVVGYIKKDGTVWYRNFCQQEDYRYVWESPKQLTQFAGTAVSLNLFITNDYRMGFVIEDTNAQVHWLITGRNWAGMALGTEQIILNATAQVQLIPVTYHYNKEIEKIHVAANSEVSFLFGSIANNIIATNVPNEENNWGWIIEIMTMHPIETITLENIVATDLYSGTNIQFTSMESLSKRHFRLHVSDIVESGINNVYGDIRILITGARNEAGYTFLTMEDTFTPHNLLPIEIPLPEVMEVWNE